MALKAAAKKALGFAMKAPGLSSAILALTGRSRFLVLAYHRVNDDGHSCFPGTPVDLFRRQMESLRRHFTVLSLRELALRARSRDVPPNAAAITFDDGYRDNYTEAFPILRKLDLPATIFLVPGAIDRDPMIWHDRVFDAFHRTEKKSLAFEGRTFAMAPAAGRDAALAAVLGKLRSLPPDPRDRAIASLLAELEVEPDPRGWEKLTWDEVREMARAGISFGAHTLDHPILSRVVDDEKRRQIRESKRRIEEELGCEVTEFAYPNGGASDFDGATERIVAEEGFALAVTTLSGGNDSSTDLYRLRRAGMWGEDPDLSVLRLALSRL